MSIKNPLRSARREGEWGNDDGRAKGATKERVDKALGLVVGIKVGDREGNFVGKET
jgi:hypothetical protein